MKTQDVSKKGLKYGDEDEDAAERKELNAQNIAFGPLLNWLKRELKAQVSDGTSFFLSPFASLSFPHSR
jgi:heat shock protein beta